MATETKFKIYTKTGDSGTSSLYNGERRPKEDQTFAALGDVDELNSALGVVVAFCDYHHLRVQSQITELQSRLLDVGSAVATPLEASSEAKRARARFDPAATAQLEVWIDELDAELPPLRNFILPSGGQAAAHLHLARSICRRAERSVAPLVRQGAVDADVGVFLNRLSDYFFQAARWAAKASHVPETVYKKAAAADAAGA